MKIDPGLEAKVRWLLERSERSLAHALGIEFCSIGQEKIIAKMPVDDRTRQPFGLLHGGASLSLAETLASVGGWLNVDEATQAVVGIEINANHIKSKRDGLVTGTAIPLHRGRRTQVWSIEIRDEEQELICISRCTLAVVRSANTESQK